MVTSVPSSAPALHARAPRRSPRPPTAPPAPSAPPAGAAAAPARPAPPPAAPVPRFFNFLRRKMIFFSLFPLSFASFLLFFGPARAPRPRALPPGARAPPPGGPAPAPAARAPPGELVPVSFVTFLRKKKGFYVVFSIFLSPTRPFAASCSFFEGQRRPRSNASAESTAGSSTARRARGIPRLHAPQRHFRAQLQRHFRAREARRAAGGGRGARRAAGRAAAARDTGGAAAGPPPAAPQVRSAAAP